MKIKLGQKTGKNIGDLECGNVFRFVNSKDEQVYQMSQSRLYQSLKTGVTYSIDTCCPDARVLRYPDAVIDLGYVEGQAPPVMTPAYTEHPEVYHVVTSDYPPDYPGSEV